MKKTLLLLLALLLCANALGCANTDTSDSDSSSTSPVENDTAAVETESETAEETEAYVFDGIESKTYGGRDFNFLYRTNEEYQFYTDEYTGDATNDAVYDRNLLVESTFECKIVGIPVDGDWGQHDAYLSSMKKSVQAGDGAYDLVDGYAATIGGAYADHLFMNLNENEHLRLTSDWWSELAVEELTCNGKLFGIPGDLSLNLWKNIHVMFFNKTVLANNNLEEPYDTVKDGRWTYDKYLEMNVGIAQDLDGNGEYTIDDMYGSIYFDDLSFDNYHNAFDITYTVKNEDGSISLNIYQPKLVEVAEKINNLAYNTPDVYYNRGGNSDNTLPVFTQNRALFYASNLADAEKMRDMDSDFGIIPFPKYDEAQEMYKSAARDGRSMFGIPVDVKDADFSGIITEALCVASNRSVVPVYYDTVLKGKISRDNESAEMLDIIRKGVTFDFVSEFSLQTARAGFILRDAVYNNKNLTTYYESNKKLFGKAFDKFIAYYMDEE